MEIKTLSNQTIFDVALMHYGTCEAVGKLMEDNPGLRNDPAALAALGIADTTSFYMDAALLAGHIYLQGLASPLRDVNTLREIAGKQITTFNMK